MKKFGVYYLIHTILNIALLIFFSSSINLQLMSILPAFLFAMMLMQACLLKSSSNDVSEPDTAFSVSDTVRLTNDEQEKLYSFLKHSFLTFAPLQIPIIFFLPIYWKFIAILPYFLAHTVGSVCFRVNMGKSIKDRINAEESELNEQIKKEEIGFK